MVSAYRSHLCGLHYLHRDSCISFSEVYAAYDYLCLQDPQFSGCAVQLLCKIKLNIIADIQVNLGIIVTFWSKSFY